MKNTGTGNKSSLSEIHKNMYTGWKQGKFLNAETDGM